MSFLYYCLIVVSFALLLLLSPIILVHALILSWRIQHQWRKHGKDVLMVFADTPSCQGRMRELIPLIEARAVFLNWSKRRTWNRWSIGPQVFRFYSFLGPQPFRLESSLPVVFVFRKIYWPSTFSFGGHQNARDLERLEDELVGTQQD